MSNSLKHRILKYIVLFIQEMLMYHFRGSVLQLTKLQLKKLTDV